VIPDDDGGYREYYLPLWDGFFEGSIMEEEVGTRFLFIVLLRLGLRPGAHGRIDIPIGRLAAQAAMSEEATRAALDALLSPDPCSGSTEEEGRRIVPLRPAQPDRGWRLVNYEAYREKLIRLMDAARKRAFRRPGPDVSGNVRRRPVASENGDKRTSTRRERELEELPLLKGNAGAVGASAPASAKRPAPASAASEFVFPTVGRVSGWTVPLEMVAELRTLYPDVDVPREIRLALTKIHRGAVSKKTPNGMPRFLFSWMARVQDRPGGMRKRNVSDEVDPAVDARFRKALDKPLNLTRAEPER
jgi:hypothetical protein